MGDEIRLEISIPADNDGFVLLQCTNCGTYFKATPSDIKDDGVLELHCPSCGLVGENYLTEDVINLATMMVQNAAMDLVHKDLNKIERQFKNGPITIKAGKTPQHEPETPIRSGIEALEIVFFPCCKRTRRLNQY